MGASAVALRRTPTVEMMRMFISTSAFSIRSVVGDASSVRIEIAVEQTRMIKEIAVKAKVF